jgi:hypothetical protein
MSRRADRVLEVAFGQHYASCASLPIRNGTADILDYKSTRAKHEKPVPPFIRRHA